MYIVILAGLTLGLGVGVSCMVLCVPVLAPHIAADHPVAKGGLYASLLFCFGRLASYSTLGVLSKLFGEIVPYGQAVTAPVVLTLGCLLALYGLSISFGFRSSIGPKICKFFRRGRSTFLLGLLAGLSPCLPLLAAVIYSATLANMVESVLFMMSFWSGSSMYTLLLGTVVGAVAGICSKRMNVERIRRISGVAMMVVGLVFIIEGTTFIAGP